MPIYIRVLGRRQLFLKCKTLPSHYYRYLDDIFGIWQGSMEEFEQFLVTLNSHHPAITITHNLQRDSIEFLDTQVATHHQVATFRTHTEPWSSEAVQLQYNFQLGGKDLFCDRMDEEIPHG